MTKTAFIFPGQGAQKVGMGKDLCEQFPVAAEVFERADDVLGMDLKKLCFEGPLEQLTRTDVSQPAILTMSIAALRAGRSAGVLGDPAMTGGLSLGEYTALCAAGALTLEEAVALVRVRGEAMQAAAEAADSGLVAVIGADEATAEAVCAEAAAGDVLVCANFNTPGQVVLSGAAAACERVANVCDRRELRCIRLPVAGAFHSPFMAPAADRLAAALAEVPLKAPAVPVAANVAGGFHDPDPNAIRDALVAQLTHTVRWQACLEAMIAAGVAQFYEIGPGRSLTGMLRKIDRALPCRALGSAKDLEEAAGEAAEGAVEPAN